MSDPADLSARRIAADVASGAITAEAVIEATLERTAAVEPRLRAFAYLDPELARAQARAVDAGKRKGALAGVPVGVKDTIDTKDMPTEGNSPIHIGRRPETDAACVAAVRKASGIVIGKTVTTEFANRRPGPTANPYDLRHTPGGSSSGSAAAVGAGLIPLAFGSQTAGSVIRPAAFCGCVGYKATRGLLSLDGMMPLSGSLDTLGGFARTPDDLLLFQSVLAGVRDSTPKLPRRPRIAVVVPPGRMPLDPAQSQALEQAASKLAAQAQIERLELPSVCARGFAAQEVVMSADSARHYEREWQEQRSLLGESFRRHLEIGRGHSPARLAEARTIRAWIIDAIDRVLIDFDAVLAPSAAGEAPKGLSWTGDPEYQRLWTFADTPCVSLPTGLGPNGLPLAVQLVGRRNSDRLLLALSDWAYRLLGRLPAPALPKSASIAAIARRAGLSLDAALTASTIEADRANRDALRRIPRDLPYEAEPAHVFRPSRRD